MERLVCSAPGRANLIGNPSDLYGGAVLSCSLGLRARVSLEAAPGLHVSTGDRELEIRDAGDLARRGDPFDVARAVLQFTGSADLRCRIHYESAIPLQSGLGGSSALMVALLHALGTWQGRSLGNYALAETARHIELRGMGVVCGYVDQYMCSFGGLRYLDFRGKAFDRDPEQEPLATVEPLQEPAGGLPFVLGFTGVRHASGAVHSPIRERWRAGDPRVVSGYARVAELAGLGKRAFLAKDWPRLGEIMNENHAIQRGFGGSGESNERLIAAALGAGALGAKLAGAGNGGTVVALGLPGEVGKLAEALRAAGAASTHALEIAPGVRIEASA